MTTPCTDIRTNLDDWLDDALPAETRADVDRHLARCPACRAAFHAQRALAADLAVLGRVAETVANGAQPTATTPSRAAWRRVAAAIAITVAGSLIGVELLQRDTAPRRTPTPIARQTKPAQPPAPQPRSVSIETRGTTAGDLLLQLPSSNPRVHIVWLYPDPGATAKPDNNHEPTG